MDDRPVEFISMSGGGTSAYMTARLLREAPGIRATSGDGAEVRAHHHSGWRGEAVEGILG